MPRSRTSRPGWASDVPAPVYGAVTAAGARYNVPPDLLAGIWRRESGSKYPNPYANGLGYGGLFGTKVVAPFGAASDVRQVANVGGPNQVNAEADQAAAVLHNALQSTGGNIAEALSVYNSGKPYGGYTSVPGQTTFGTVGGYGSPASPVTVPGTGASLPLGTSRPRPGTGGGGGGVLGTIGGWFSSAGSGVLSALGSAAQTAAGLVSGPAEFLKLAVWLIMPQTWLRIFEVVAGGLLMLLSLRGLFLILASRGTPVDFYTVGGAARSLHQRHGRRTADTLIPGNAERRHSRRERKAKAGTAARLTKTFGEVPF